MQTLIYSTVLIHSFATVAILLGAALAACLPRIDELLDRPLSRR